MSIAADPFAANEFTCFEDVLIYRDVSAIYSSSGERVDDFFLERKWGLKSQGFPPETADASKIKTSLDKETAVINYSCWLKWLNFDHFGHLLTETVSSIWPLLLDFDTSAQTEIIFLVPARQAARGLTQLKKIFPEHALKICSVSDLNHSWISCNKLVLPHQTIVNKSHVVPAHFKYVRLFLERYMRFYLEIDFSHSIKNMHESLHAYVRTNDKHNDFQRIYLSRSVLPPSKRLFVEEIDIENELIRQGWCVIHPEKLPLNIQLELLKQAKVIAGSRGSAFHLLMALSKQELEHKKIIFLDKNNTRSDHDTFHMQFAAQKLNATIIPCLKRYADDAGRKRVRLVVKQKWEDIAVQINQYE